MFGFQGGKPSVKDFKALMPEHNVIDDGVLLSDFSNLSQWTVAGSGTLTPDTDHKTTGKQGGKLSVTTTGMSVLMVLPINVDKPDSIEFDIYVPDVADLQYLSAQFTSTTDFSKHYDIYVYDKVNSGGWTRVKFNASEFTTDSGETWGSIKNLRFYLKANADHTLDVTFGEVRINRKTKAKAILQFDGPFASVYTIALPILNKYGFKGGLNLIPSFIEDADVGNPDYITSVQALELQNIYGWTMGGHSVSNGDYRALTDAQIISENEQCRDWQIANGLDSAYEHMSYPRGFADNRVASVVSGSFIKTARASMIDLTPQEQPVGPLDMWMLNATITLSPTSTFATNIKPLIDKVVAHGGVFYPYMHGFSDTPTGDNSTTAEFSLMIDYLALLVSQGEIDVVTINEWYKEYTQQSIPQNYLAWGNTERKGYITTDIASIVAGAIATFTITVTGANIGDSVLLSAPSAIEVGLVWSGFVSAKDTVTVRVHNTTAGDIDPAIGTWMARVIN
jgi:hypothetical protein